jgi:hypothetical protein
MKYCTTYAKMATRPMFVAVLALAMGVASTAASADTTLGFDDIPEGTVAAAQYNGLVITGGSVLTLDSILNPEFPPHSDPNVLYNYADGNISILFTTAVDSIGGYITGNEVVTLSAYNGATLLGTIATSGPNYVSSGGSPNEFLQLLFPTITSAVFSGATGFENTYTLDDLTVGGTITVNGVPEPATWAMMLLGFGAIGASMRRRRSAAVVVVA